MRSMNNTEKLFNNGKMNRRNLKDKKTWRYGGISRQFERTAKEWREEHERVLGKDSDNPYLNCSVCGRNFNDSEYLYQGVFSIKPAKYKYRLMFKVLCKDCAYKISDAVIEADGTEIAIDR